MVGKLALICETQANGNLSNQTAQIHSTAKELSKAEEAVAVERGKAEEIQCKLHTTVSQLNSSEESYLLLVSECNQLELDLEDIRSHQRGAGKHSVGLTLFLLVGIVISFNI